MVRYNISGISKKKLEFIEGIIIKMTRQETGDEPLSQTGKSILQ